MSHTPQERLGAIASHLCQGDSTTDDRKKKLAEEATSYNSRQIALFKADPNTVPSGAVITAVANHSVPHIKEWIKDVKSFPNHFARTRLFDESKYRTEPSRLIYRQLIKEGEAVLVDIVCQDGVSKAAQSFVRAGPRKNIVWAPGEVRAAVVTCGGLCPGLNDVIAEIFNTLYYNYGVDTVFGIRNGYRGFWKPEYTPWQKLTPEEVLGIHEKGGTILGSSRGGWNLEKIVQSLVDNRVNQLYIIGGDGTHRAGTMIAKECAKRGLKIAVAGVPKTIDNDIGVIDRSFGFNTAVSEARKAIMSAVVEARCTPGGVGIVKLMGRHSGFIAANATLAAREVDLCLIPEVPFQIEGDDGVLQYIHRVVKRQKYAVVVVAEGAGEEHLQAHGSHQTDAEGKSSLPDIAPFLQQKLKEYFKKTGLEISIKYHDPSYMIRSVPADAADSVYCQSLAQNAVHGAMAGYTAFTSAVVNNRSVLLPMAVVTATSPSFLNPMGRTWERVVSLTHQPQWAAKPLLIAPAAAATVTAAAAAPSK